MHKIMAQRSTDQLACEVSEDSFKSLVERGETWPNLIARNILDSTAYDIQEKQVADLIEQRDVLDHEHFRKAIRECFPKEKFSMNEPPRVETEQLIYYKFIVSITPHTGGLDPKAHSFEIVIKAPGSRTVTSDIDTTIEVHGANKHTDPLVKITKFLTKGSDLNRAIAAEIIDKFYQFSEIEFGMTSGSNRDSNVYVQGFLANDQTFEITPKYLGVSSIAELTPAVRDKLERLAAAYFANELAASLVSFREALGEEKWRKFHKISSQEFGRNDVLHKALEFSDELAHEKTKLMDAKMGVIKDSGRLRLKKTAGEDSIVYKRDVEVSALNSLYVQKLLEAATISGRNPTLNKVTEQAKDLEELAQQLESNPKLHGMYKRQKKALQTTYLAYLRGIVEMQEAQIKANLFANEAYVNRSAPYLVVKGDQSGEPVEINPVLALASGLQQIGFRLLHSQEFTKAGMRSGEVAYRVAKYSDRVAGLIFPEEKRLPLRPVELFDFVKHKSSVLAPYFDGIPKFSLEELLLLNGDVELVKDVKKGKYLAPYEKDVVSSIYLARRAGVLRVQKGQLPQKEEKLMISFARKFFSLGFRTAYNFSGKLENWGILRAMVKAEQPLGAVPLEEKPPMFTELGLISSSRNDSGFQAEQTRFWKSAKYSIVMMGISGGEFLSDGRIGAIRQLLDSNPSLHIRMLIMDPNSEDVIDPYDHSRVKKTDPTLSPDLIKKIKATLESSNLENLRRDYGKRQFEIKLMKKLPTYTVDLLDSQSKPPHTRQVRVMYRLGLKDWKGEPDIWRDTPIITYQETKKVEGHVDPYNKFAGLVEAVWERGSNDVPT